MAAVRGQEDVTYEVILSFGGKDICRTFISHLYTALKKAGIQAFKDDEFVKAENIESKWQKAIEDSKISIIVFSKDYASSEWCLDELVRILDRRKTVGHKVLPIFYGVKPSEVKSQRGCFAESFSKHEDRVKAETDERKRKAWNHKVEGWRAALSDVGNLSGMVLQDQANGWQMALKM